MEKPKIKNKKLQMLKKLKEAKTQFMKGKPSKPPKKPKTKQQADGNEVAAQDDDFGDGLETGDQNMPNEFDGELEKGDQAIDGFDADEIQEQDEYDQENEDFLREVQTKKEKPALTSNKLEKGWVDSTKIMGALGKGLKAKVENASKADVKADASKVEKKPIPWGFKGITKPKDEVPKEVLEEQQK
jgi:hypothetical protein